jgi:hypothetical protein
MTRNERNKPKTESEALDQYIKNLDIIRERVEDLVFTDDEADLIIEGLMRELRDQYPPTQFPDVEEQ